MTRRWWACQGSAVCTRKCGRRTRKCTDRSIKCTVFHAFLSAGDRTSLAADRTSSYNAPALADRRCRLVVLSF